MGKSRATKDEQKEKLKIILLDEDIYAGLSDEINELRDALLGDIDNPRSTEKLYQAVGGRKACTNLLVRIEGLRNESKEKQDLDSPT